MSFTHLHVHTEYSLLDGVNRIPKLFERTKELGMSSIAMSDHGVLYGAAEFWKSSKDFGIKPIIGCEIYVAPTERTLKQPVEGIKYYHLLLLAKNLTGYRNLVKIVSTGQLEGMYYKPRVDREILTKYSEGIICTSACLAGPLSKHIMRKQYDKAEDWLQFLNFTFKDNFYLELQRHGYDGAEKIDQNFLDRFHATENFELEEETIDDSNEQKFVNTKLMEYAHKYNLPMVATTDAHYLKKEDKDVQTVLFCIKDGKKVTDDSCRTGYEGTYILSPEEMEAKFADDKSVLENTLKIAEQVESYSLKFERVQPQFWNIPKGSSARDELKKQAYKGALDKYKITNTEFTIEQAIGDIEKMQFEKAQILMGKELTDRVEYELRVIDQKGYNDYFLVVGDLMQYGRRNGILVGARGSAAGSVVSYVLDITNAEPLRWELYFERFLNEERQSPPDIDMDIQDDRRDEIIAYAKEKYGEECVAAICTFGKLKTKAAIRDVARVMGIDLQVADKLSKMVTVLFGKPFSIDKMMETDPEFARIINSSDDLKKLANTVKKIDGMSRHISTHAAGYLITPEPITNYMALQRDSKDPEKIITQMDGTFIDKLDFMKFDFLGLRTLTIIKNALDYVKKNHDVTIDITRIPEDDEASFKLFSRAETVGVFQFESPPMQQFLKDLQPENLDDICFLAAAYRPGPMQYIPAYIECKHGKRQPDYLIPELEPILNKTFGFPIYQEQLLKICMELADFKLADGDVIRNALKKKQLDILQAKEVDFKKNFLEKFPQYAEEIAVKLWKQLEPFSDYGFNKAHSASYAIVAYWCAYLKAHYPLEFITALMHSDLQDLDRVVIDINEARRLGFEILPPSVNLSEVYFSTRDEKTIVFGLGAIKNVGSKICEAIVAERELNGNYTSVDDLIFRLADHKLNRRTLESLTMSGALDEFGDRNALLKVLPEILERSNKKNKDKDSGQTSLFDTGEVDPVFEHYTATPLPEAEITSSAQRIEWEKDLLGLFLTSHPMENYKWVSLSPGYTQIAEIEKLSDGKQVKIACVLNSIKITHTKKNNDRMAIVNIEDYSGKIDGVIFPKAFEEIEEREYFGEAKVIIIKGKINSRDDKKSIIIEDIASPVIMKPPTGITLDICEVENKELLSELKSCFSETGDVEVLIEYGSKRAPRLITRLTTLAPENIQVLQKWIKR